MSERIMSPEEMTEYLQAIHITTLATLKRDGSPQLSPVWYQYRDRKIYIIANRSTAKVHNIRRDPRVSLSVSTPHEPYSYVLVYGNAEILTDEVEAVATAICIRYKGHEEGAAFAEEVLLGGGTVAIEVTPVKMVSWALER